jgi:sensor histidine kinase YesM
MTWGFGFIMNKPPIKALYKSLSLIAGSLLVVYPLLYLLIPRYLVKRKFFLFFLGYAVVLLLAKFITGYLEEVLIGVELTYKAFASSWGNLVLPYTNLAGIAASLKIIRHSFFEENKAQTAIHEQSIAELELLKAQIHPHFLFNTLNNLYTHTKRKSSDSPQIVLSLSELLRFMIYESRADFIPLTQEIQLIKNYVELEKYRFGDDLDISLTFSGDLDGKLIRPLLLLPLLENAIKHGTSENLEQKWISLDLNVEKNMMHFKLANSYDSNNLLQELPAIEKGISLKNVKRRLELLYTGEHYLMIKAEPDLFLIKLDIKLKKDRNVKTNVTKPETAIHDLEMPTGR